MLLTEYLACNHAQDGKRDDADACNPTLPSQSLSHGFECSHSFPFPCISRETSKNFELLLHNLFLQLAYKLSVKQGLDQGIPIYWFGPNRVVAFLPFF